jgi:MYXO-CTERM domain-containing protein
VYGEAVLLFLARLSFAAEESPTCGDGDQITLEIEDQDAATYEWGFGEDFFDQGGEVLDTTGTTTTIRCPDCLDGGSYRYDVQVQALDENGNLTWAYAYFEQECPSMDGAEGCSCASSGGGSAWLSFLALAFLRRRS